MKIINCEQGTPEWKAARVGRVTASRITDILASGKGGKESVSRRDYRMELACEILTGEPQGEIFSNAAIRWGSDQEPFGRAAFEVETGFTVDQVGMVIHPMDNRCAASPDGLVGWDGETEPGGLVEIKCPKTATHIGYIEAGVVPADYQPQMLWQMACTGAQWVDFVSFDPRLGGKAENLQLYICRFGRDEARIAEVEREVARFLEEVDCLVATLVKLGEVA